MVFGVDGRGVSGGSPGLDVDARTGAIKTGGLCSGHPNPMAPNGDPFILTANDIRPLRTRLRKESRAQAPQSGEHPPTEQLRHTAHGAAIGRLILERMQRRWRGVPTDVVCFRTLRA